MFGPAAAAKQNKTKTNPIMHTYLALRRQGWATAQDLEKAAGVSSRPENTWRIHSLALAATTQRRCRPCGRRRLPGRAPKHSFVIAS